MIFIWNSSPTGENLSQLLTPWCDKLTLTNTRQNKPLTHTHTHYHDQTSFIFQLHGYNQQYQMSLWWSHFYSASWCFQKSEHEQLCAMLFVPLTHTFNLLHCEAVPLQSFASSGYLESGVWHCFKLPTSNDQKCKFNWAHASCTTINDRIDTTILLLCTWLILAPRGLPPLSLPPSHPHLHPTHTHTHAYTHWHTCCCLYNYVVSLAQCHRIFLWHLSFIYLKKYINLIELVLICFKMLKY